MARKVWVTVKPLAKHEKIAAGAGGDLAASINAPASEGKANRRLIELLVEFFHTAKSKIRIVRGQQSKRKLIEVDAE
ncbi:MAG: DUF167 domain-containing protein [Deltaproteobacteria bacterium]|nr:DUF167 domain-containing protein [Deltaproteobacteria bacterium]